MYEAHKRKEPNYLNEAFCLICLQDFRANEKTDPATTAWDLPDSISAAITQEVERDEETTSPESVVDRPAHYTSGKIECIDAIDAVVSQLKNPVSAFYVGQIFKYLWRHERKGESQENLLKAQWYLNRLVKMGETTR